MMKVVEEDVGKENHTNCGRTGRAANGPKWPVCRVEGGEEYEGGERLGRTRAKANRMDGVRAGKGRLKELRA